jgi:hypothetical protein
MNIIKGDKTRTGPHSVDVLEKKWKGRTKMKYLKISNSCTIDEAAFHLIGASSKRGDNTKIGFFGSGLKYAIATLLRNNIKFRVFSGKTEVIFSTKKVSFREEELSVICINGKETSLTTDLGPTWKPWMALREIVCNALDEDGASFSTCEQIEPDETTSFYIDLEGPVLEFHKKWDEYVSFNRVPVYENVHGRVYNRVGKKPIIYRKGVRCYENMSQSLYDYDFNDIPIDESRIANEFNVMCYGAKLWMSCDNEVLLRGLIDLMDERKPFCKERQFHWDCVNVPFTLEWKNVLEDRFIIPINVSGLFLKEQSDSKSLIFDSDLARTLQLRFPELNHAGSFVSGDQAWIRREISPADQYRIDKALSFFKEVKINITAPIEVVTFSSKNVLGRAKDGKILLSEKALSKGIRVVARIILEEHAHLESNYNDETREFENYLFEQIITMLENHNGIFL